MQKFLLGIMITILSVFSGIGAVATGAYLGDSDIQKAVEPSIKSIQTSIFGTHQINNNIQKAVDEDSLTSDEEVLPTTEVYEQDPSQIDAYDSQTNDLSNDNYYTNTDGNEVHSPAYSDSVPDGATAQCNDGTYSFSQNHRGTCSGHDGVDSWL